MPPMHSWFSLARFSLLDSFGGGVVEDGLDQALASGEDSRKEEGVAEARAGVWLAGRLVIRNLSEMFVDPVVQGAGKPSSVSSSRTESGK